MEKYLTYFNTLALVVLVVLVGFGGHSAVKFGSVLGSATTFYDLNLDTSNGIGSGTLSINGNTVIASSTAGANLTASGLAATTVTATTSVTIGGGTAISKYSCATATWNPGSLTSSTAPLTAATTTDIALAGAVVGDICSASLTSATSSQYELNCNIYTAATGTIQLFNVGNAAIDPATGTAKVCYFH